jgi:predicted exporter
MDEPEKKPPGATRIALIVAVIASLVGLLGVLASSGGEESAMAVLSVAGLLITIVLGVIVAIVNHRKS